MLEEQDGAEGPKFSAAIDNAIIKGFINDRASMFKKLKAKGFTKNAILDRAKHLGLSDQFLKWCNIGNPNVALRTCLQCGKRFLSVGIQNRLCGNCKD